MIFLLLFSILYFDRILLICRGFVQFSIGVEVIESIYKERGVGSRMQLSGKRVTVFYILKGAQA